MLYIWVNQYLANVQMLSTSMKQGLPFNHLICPCGLPVSFNALENCVTFFMFRCKRSPPKNNRFSLVQLYQMWVGEVERSQIFIYHCFYGIFDPILQTNSCKFMVKITFSVPKLSFSGDGWLGSQVWYNTKQNR